MMRRVSGKRYLGFDCEARDSKLLSSDRRLEDGNIDAIGNVGAVMVFWERKHWDGRKSEVFS